MGTRDLLKAVGRRILGRKPADPPPAKPPPASAAARVGNVERADLWAVRYALEGRGKPLIVNHWATWCDGCVIELPLLVGLQGRIGDKAEFLGISWELFSTTESPEAAIGTVARVSAQYGLAWKSLVFDGPPRELFTGLELSDEHIPQTFVFDGDGAEKYRHHGELGPGDIDAIEALVRRLG